MKQLIAALLTAVLVAANPMPIFSAKGKVVSNQLLKRTSVKAIKASDRIIVKYKDRGSMSSLKSTYKSKKQMKSGAFKLVLKPGQNAQDLVQRLNDDPRVEYAEPDYVRKVSMDPNDSYYSLQWGLKKIQAPAAWDIETGASTPVTVAVIDTGVDFAHPDLSNQLVAGVDIVNNDTYPQDDNGHGTHVAGIIGAASNNGEGVAGVSWGVKIMPIKVLDYDGGGYDSWVADGIRQAVDMGANIVSMSLGGSGYSETLKEATDYALSRNVPVIAASGNTGDSTTNYPAGNPGVIGVGATDNNDQIADFSTFNSTVDVSAPGVDIASTYWYYGQSVYAYSSGTSMATPMVSGLAALVKSKWPTYGVNEINSRLTDFSDDLGSFGRDDYFGYGRINAHNALNASASMTNVSVKNLLMAGQKTILRGSIKPIAASRTVQVFQKGVGAPAWSLYKQTVTDGSGLFNITVKPNKNTYYRVYSPASVDMAEAQKVVKVNVKPKMSYKFKRVGTGLIKIRGSVLPKAVKIVGIKMVVKGKWRTIKKLPVRGGKFATFIKKGSGLIRIKITIPASKDYLKLETKEKRIK